MFGQPRNFCILPHSFSVGFFSGVFSSSIFYIHFFISMIDNVIPILFYLTSELLEIPRSLIKLRKV